MNVNKNEKRYARRSVDERNNGRYTKKIRKLDYRKIGVDLYVLYRSTPIF